MGVKVIIVCPLPLDGIRSIASHDYIFHVEGSKEVIDSFSGSFSWEFEGGLDCLVIQSLDLLEFQSLGV